RTWEKRYRVFVSTRRFRRAGSENKADQRRLGHRPDAKILPLASNKVCAKQWALVPWVGGVSMILRVRQPALLPASMSLSASPTIHDDLRSIWCSSAAVSSIPGSGLRQSHGESLSCGQ